MRAASLYSGADSNSRVEGTNNTLMDSHFDAGEEDTMNDRSSMISPSESKTSKPVENYNDNTVAFDHPPSKVTDGYNYVSPACTTTGREFAAIARDAALLLDKKLEKNREWVKKLLHEMTVHAETLSEVHSECQSIQRLEFEESLRLDQVEPYVQGATSHLLENPLPGGLVSQMTSEDGATLGTKRKSDET